MGYKSFCCLLLLLTGNVSLRAQGIDDISPMAIYNIGLVGCDSIGVNVLKTFISTGEARCVAVFDEKTTLAESTEREITSIQDKAPLLYNDLFCGNDDACNDQHQIWLNPFTQKLSDKSFYDLYDEAMTQYLDIVSDFSMAFTDEEYRERMFFAIGNRSYKTGMEIIKN